MANLAHSLLIINNNEKKFQIVLTCLLPVLLIIPVPWYRTTEDSRTPTTIDGFPDWVAIALFTSTVFLFTGWVAIPLFSLDSGFQADQVLPRLLEQWAASNLWNRISAMMVLLAILAAIMSTADSVLLSVVSMIRHDLLKNTQREGLKYDTTITIILMSLVSIPALYRDITL